MGFFSNIKHKQIKSFTKGACRAMLLGFGIAEAEVQAGKFEARVYGDLAAKALSARPGWKMVEQNVFEYKDGQQRKITQEDSLADVVHDVCFIEMKTFIESDNKPGEIIGIILEEIMNYFKMPDSEWEEFVRRKTREGWYVANLL
ncbi:MAG: hypothetical protein A2418_01385 [Candidatus Brennerbacteria bacterium RIFOXYC1_FULL_41_11]|uniref:Uncharacterized protein n=1 Tax=Candidatus Brennerbacteria bacterium RIFOXYD1_FULL_41_16 TaxID=1797529 RepID=A0A1G1XLE8_9BACT|nr:MAG: hypothetical protein A2418_01385 [Candidatus Brennerbacteria bacterium RIFOXYC1_FULL_41_11]OGY40506.1 MAG: hypothetical protein A2570_02045 [Candidatus Brennerbacteria bacterium RIFOXYD1_FULL_41_16]